MREGEKGYEGDGSFQEKHKSGEVAGEEKGEGFERFIKRNESEIQEDNEENERMRESKEEMKR